MDRVEPEEAEDSCGHDQVSELVDGEGTEQWGKNSRTRV